MIDVLKVERYTSTRCPHGSQHVVIGIKIRLIDLSKTFEQIL